MITICRCDARSVRKAIYRLVEYGRIQRVARIPNTGLGQRPTLFVYGVRR